MSRVDWSHIESCPECHRGDELCPEHKPDNRLTGVVLAILLAGAGWLALWVFALRPLARLLGADL